MLTETLGEALDTIVDLPFNLLTVIGVFLILGQRINLGNRFSSFIDVSSVVNRADEVVDNLKKLGRIPAEVQTLSRS